MHQIRTEQIEFVIQSHELTHQFVLHLALHQFIVPSYSYLDFVFHRVFACRKPHFNFRVTYPADRYRRHPVGCLLGLSLHGVQLLLHRYQGWRTLARLTCC
jgi:hypothetical protein